MTNNLLETLTQLSQPLLEDKGHLDHPEDAIFLGGSQYANKAVDAVVATVQNPAPVSYTH
jgi:hypothetical protein